VTGPLLDPAARAAATEADRRAQLDGGLVALACLHCGGRVRARRQGPTHTSIQWSAEATLACSAYTVPHGCPYLAASVEELAVGGG
jgi:hypothetical protein